MTVKRSAECGPVQDADSAKQAPGTLRNYVGSRAFFRNQVSARNPSNGSVRVPNHRLSSPALPTQLRWNRKSPFSAKCRPMPFLPMILALWVPTRATRKEEKRFPGFLLNHHLHFDAFPGCREDRRTVEGKRVRGYAGVLYEPDGAGGDTGSGKEVAA